ncbi:MAG: acyl-CoA dehydrogenase family protein [Haloferacaceae archaeon]|jgi:acyl-CoA dehydrogenase
MSVPRFDLDLTDEQVAVRESIRAITDGFDHEYWRDHARRGTYPQAFVDDLADEGWLGVLIPEEYGGKGLGTEETVVMMEEIAASGAGFGGAQTVHGGIYNSAPIVEYANERQREELLPKIASGEVAIQAFGLTEPGAGSDSPSMETFAERDGDEYVVSGEKYWISRVDVSDYMLLVARTTPKAAVEKHTRGISTFLVDLADAEASSAMTKTPIEKSASTFVNSYHLEFDGLRVPAENLVGEEGEGFYQVLDGLNEERLVIAAELIGMAELALAKGSDYAADREVFGRPVGKNQGIQHPLASAHAEVQAARHLTYEAAARSAAGDLPREALGARANAAKYLGAEAAFSAADAAVQAHGGKGIAVEYDVERYFREARLSRLVPIAQQLALNYLGERELGLPRSY